METMKTPPVKPQHDATTKPVKDEVAVYELRFKAPYPDLGLRGMSGGSGTVRTKSDVKIAYLPNQLLYRIIETSADSKKARTVFVPREWASFEIAE